MQIIGIAGKMGSGKDTIADVLVARYGFRRISMADAIRAECASAIERGRAPDGCPDDIRQIVERDGWGPGMVYAKPTVVSMRRLLQYWGTEHRRAQDPDYWVKRTREALGSIAGPVVIPDIRFANEAALVRELGGQVWIVRRSQADATRDPAAHSHISEQFCDQYTRWDAAIQNDGTLDDLSVKVRDIMRCHQELKRCADLLASDKLTKSEREGCAGGQIDWQRELREVSLPIYRVEF